MRLFIALFPPENVVEEIENVLKRCHRNKGVRWVGRESLHLTLKFLGDVAPETRPEMESALSALCRKQSPFSLQCRSWGLFPHLRKPRIFWTHLEGDRETVSRLAGLLADEMVSHGFAKEDRDFVPHLTLGRARGAVPSTLVEQFGKLFDGFQTAMFQVNSIQLVQSHLSAQGVRYEILRSFPFGPSDING